MTIKAVDMPERHVVEWVEAGNDVMDLVTNWMVLGTASKGSPKAPLLQGFDYSRMGKALQGWFDAYAEPSDFTALAVWIDRQPPTARLRTVYKDLVVPNLGAISQPDATTFCRLAVQIEATGVFMSHVITAIFIAHPLVFAEMGIAVTMRRWLISKLPTDRGVIVDLVWQNPGDHIAEELRRSILEGLSKDTSAVEHGGSTVAGLAIGRLLAMSVENSPANSEADTGHAGGEWDVFLSFKSTTLDGNQTRDSELAKHLYEELRSIGLRVFFSNISLESLGVSAYKQAIDDALSGCRVLIAVGTSPEHLGSRWVRSEWDSFDNAIKSGWKPDGGIFVLTESMAQEQLPWTLRQYQAFDNGADDIARLCRFVANAIGDSPTRTR